MKFAFFAAILISSSGMTNVSLHQYHDPVRKLTLHVAETSWDFFEGSDQAKNSDLNLQFIARSQGVSASEGQSTLTLRIDTGHWSSARNYGERWLKEYPKFGFELQMSKESQYGQLKGFEMELSANASNRRVRQFVVNRPDEMWIFTCSSGSEQFKSAWQACEKILGTAKAD